MLTYEAQVASILVDGKPLAPLGSPASADERAWFERWSEYEARVSFKSEALAGILRHWRQALRALPARKPSLKQKRKAKRKAQRQARRRQR